MMRPQVLGLDAYAGVVALHGLLRRGVIDPDVVRMLAARRPAFGTTWSYVARGCAMIMVFP